MQKIYVPTPKKKVIDNDAVEIDESKMRTYTATRIKKRWYIYYICQNLYFKGWPFPHFARW